MSGFSENQKEFLTSRLPRTQYWSKVLLTIWFSTWWQVARMKEEKTIHKFLNKEKDKKIYDVWVDRYVTVGF